MNLIQLQPDDVLVLRCPGRMSQAQRDAALAGLRDYLGSDRKVIFLDAGETLDVLRGVDLAKAQGEQPGSSWTVGGKPLTEALAQREVQHVDTDEPEATGIPPHVWLYRNMLTDLQAVAPLGRDETNGQYAVAIDELTDEQRAIPHVSKQLPGDVLSVAVDAGLKIEENDIVRREV
ncbi:MAG: hypothetical protein NTX28_07695 [Novosphingobium sp.]|nr:hypothetical protein [Novosphingobium sp.]